MDQSQNYREDKAEKDGTRIRFSKQRKKTNDFIDIIQIYVYIQHKTNKNK